jgi:hypothetical protein
MKKNTLYKYASIIGILTFTTILPQSLNAAPHNQQSRHKSAPAIGAFVGIQAPTGAVSIRVGNFSFKYNNGTYYKHTKHGYIVAPAPRGAIVHSLPPTRRRIVTNGYVYYSYNNVYYRQAPNGYIVVEPPVTIIKESPTIVTTSTTAPLTAEVSVWQGEQELLLRNGQFFRNTSAGLVWVELPVGSITKSIPSDATSIWHKEIEYFDVDGVLFRKTPDGYKVVQAPWES